VALYFLLDTEERPGGCPGLLLVSPCVLVFSGQQMAVECCEEDSLHRCGVRGHVLCFIFLFHSFVSYLLGKLRRLLGLHQLSFN